MSFWQRVGRAGRGREGLALFLPSANSALDLYFAEHPEGPVSHLFTHSLILTLTLAHSLTIIAELLGKDMERVAFNSEYPTILGKHMWCASVESGIEVQQWSLVFFRVKCDGRHSRNS